MMNHKTILSSIAFVGAMVVAAPATVLACEGMKKQPVITTMTIEDAVQAKPTFVDANSATTRSKHGVIPGAILLSSYDKYDVQAELKTAADSTLVFYCANEKCSASKVAAQRAMEAGHSKVAILPAGIEGWKRAGMKASVESSTPRRDS